MKFRVGDRVRIKKGLTNDTTGIDESDLAEMLGKVFIVDQEGFVNKNGEQRSIRLFDNQWCFKEEWLEMVDDAEKFEAFLRDVVDGRGFDNTKQYCWVKELVEVDSSLSNKAEKLIKNLVEFYETFEYEPKKEKKKLTIAELREIVGEDFEIVEE